MTFRVGQEVECINDAWNANDSSNHPKRGGRYVIVEILKPNQFCAEPCDHLDLKGFLYGHYASSHFRPIVKRQTDISFAHDILRKTSRKDQVPA